MKFSHVQLSIFFSCCELDLHHLHFFSLGPISITDTSYDYCIHRLLFYMGQLCSNCFFFCHEVSSSLTGAYIYICGTSVPSRMYLRAALTSVVQREAHFVARKQLRLPRLSLECLFLSLFLLNGLEIFDHLV